MRLLILSLLIISISYEVAGQGGPGGRGGPGGPGGPGGQNPPGSGGQNPQGSGDDKRPPPEPNQGSGDRRPRPTSEPTQPPVPIAPGSCDPNDKYYAADGGCNNLNSANWGRAETLFKRYLDPVYADGKSSPRTKSVNGQSLPNPRFISRQLMVDNSQFETDYSDLLVYFGQWQAHDFAEILDTKRNDEFVECPCGSTDPDCLAYEVPAGDTQLTQTCFEFTRSGSKTIFNVRQQENHLSSFIDASQVYGRNKEVQDELRTFQGGLMRTSEENYLPRSTEDFTCNADGTGACFVGGEDRNTENLALLGVHTLFVREHNRLANALRSKHRDWDDEKLYQEARRINIAQIQNIIYKEWLPLIIGSRANDIVPQNSGYFTGYDSSISPALANEFGVAAFRFGHTLIRNQLDRFNLFHQNVNSPVNLSSIIFDVTEATNTAFGVGGVEAIFIGLLDQPTAKFDGSLADTLQNHLFEFADEDGSTIALDLAATNINRGRDHAVPSYSKFIEYCYGGSVTNWGHLANYMTTANIIKLRNVYADVRDVDLFVGGIHETPANGGLVGKTFGCIIDKQFTDLKKGDRLYFENGPSSTSFSTQQLDEIRKVSMSSLICKNYGLLAIQPKAFKMPDSGNSRVPCNSITGLNINSF